VPSFGNALGSAAASLVRRVRRIIVAESEDSGIVGQKWDQPVQPDEGILSEKSGVPTNRSRRREFADSS
jgi:hypothetical protein